jgi:hypothetical protein
MRIKGRVQSGGRVTAVWATTRITTDRIVARATGARARIGGRPTEFGAARRQETECD